MQITVDLTWLFIVANTISSWFALLGPFWAYLGECYRLGLTYSFMSASWAISNPEVAFARGCLVLVVLPFVIWRSLIFMILGTSMVVNGVKIVWQALKNSALTASRPLNNFLLNRKMKRMILRQVKDRIEQSEIPLEGTLGWDTAGPFLRVYIAGVEHKVRMQSHEVGALLANPRLPPRFGNETIVKTSVPVPSSLPRFVVKFELGGTPVGFGFRAGNGKGVDYLFTAKHVIDSIIASGAGFSLTANGKEYAITREDFAQVEVGMISAGLDMVALKLHQAAYGALGVGMGRFSKTGLQMPTRVYGTLDGTDVFNTGVTTKVCSGMKFRHTSSTLPGWSGAPIVSLQGSIIGMHIQGFEQYNVGVSFDWLLQKETRESDFNLQAFHNDVEESVYDETEEEKWEARVRRRMGEEEQTIELFGMAGHYAARYSAAEDTEAWSTKTRMAANLGNWDLDVSDEEYFADAPRWESGFQVRSIGGPNSGNTSGRKPANESDLTPVMVSISKTLDVITKRLEALENRPSLPQTGSWNSSLSFEDSVGPTKAQEESGDLSRSMPVDTEKESPRTDGTPTKTPPPPPSKKEKKKKTKAKSPASPSTSDVLRKLVVALEPLYIHLSQPDFEKAACLLISDPDDRALVISQLSDRMQARNARKEKTDSAKSSGPQ